MRAARSPSHGKGKRNPNIASEGMVCKIFASAMTGRAHRGERVSHMPAGTAIADANNIAAAVSQRCSSVRVAIWPPYLARKEEFISFLPDDWRSMSIGLRRDGRRECRLRLRVL